MKKIRFILAIPRTNEGSLPEKLVGVSGPREVIATGPRIWVADHAPVQSLGKHGVVVGHLFDNATDQVIPDFAFEQTLSSTAAFQFMIAQFWGAYLVVQYDISRSHWAVMVDPSGLLPVYRQEVKNHTLFTSDPALLRLHGPPGPRVEWSRLASFLARPELRQRVTCLTGIEELRPGAMLIRGKSGWNENVVWSPGSFLPRGDPVTFEEAAAALRNCLIRIMGAWTRELEKPVVAVSGGVDSSLICAALAASGHRFGCVTMATSDRSGDERVYAQQLATHLGAPLEEFVYDPSAFDPFLPASAGQARPHRRLFSTAFDVMLRSGADALESTVILDGNGGDNLFCYLHSAAPVVDRWLSGLGLRATIATLADMCRVTGCDVPTMIRASLRRLNKQPVSDWPADTHLLSDRRLGSIDFEPLTPWLKQDCGQHVGKRDHLALIMRAQNHTHGFGPGPPRFSPLMSQPIVELCLGVPTWLWPKGGRNRALARMAFAPDLPASIIARTSKAGPDSFVRGIFKHHRSAFRELLLDGELAAKDVVDRRAVESAFGVETSSPGSTIYRLLDLVEAENWARSWT